MRGPELRKKAALTQLRKTNLERVITDRSCPMMKDFSMTRS